MKISRKSAKKIEKTKNLKILWFSAVLGLCGSERAQKKLQNVPLDVQQFDDAAENGPSESSKSCQNLVHVDICGAGSGYRAEKDESHFEVFFPEHLPHVGFPPLTALQLVTSVFCLFLPARSLPQGQE